LGVLAKVRCRSLTDAAHRSGHQQQH
jgi:hypothetical protein